MIKKIFGILLIMCITLVAGASAVLADDDAKDDSSFTIDNTRIVTADRNATFIEGKVDEAIGQTMLVKLGFHVIAEKTLPSTGMQKTFRIKIPKKYISEKRLNVFNVTEENGKKGKASHRERVEITYVARENQTINVSDKHVSLTYPGLDKEIKAKASSGENLIYSSSNPDVVKVDSKGKLVASGGGDATITVKQIGSSKYEGAEESVKVSVEEVDAYTITYHSSADEKDEQIKKLVANGTEYTLDDLTFENGDHSFLGWATSDDGLVKYKNADQVTDLAEKGENVDLYAVWTGDGARAAVAWAIDIANDDSFTYGKKPATSSVGCYFCGTNQRKKPAGYEKTYVCLTFVTAAFAHGAEDPEMLRDCTSGRDCVVCNDGNFRKYSCWEKIGYCNSLTIDDLQPGDVISWYNEDGYDNGHVAIYIGDNKIVDAEGIDACWSPASIAVREEGSISLRAAAKHHSRSYVMRYVGPNAGK